ncbi:excisionase family DNA-binding protein [Streptomyces sp. NBC_00885]|uniref:excisionase family DNA-binding protein n=1 Tax=Streptomyces sp. NBC_00885 TaxID=2975857 RepID=UPI00386E20A0|nr:excisionase family DNA-binding protein [Streptomyces sp. NBC_00885]
MNERYLSVDQVAEVLGTTVRFPRRLIEERRIEYVKVGRHVRIPESAIREYIASHTIQPRQPRAALKRAA